MALNLHRKHFTIGYKNSLPFVHVFDDGRKSAHGIEPELMQTLSEYFNFTYEYKSLANQTWNNIYDFLDQNLMDFGMGGIMMTDIQRKNYRFLYPHVYETMTFAIYNKQMNMADQSIKNLISPFDSAIWTCLLLSFASLLIFDQIYYYLYRSYHNYSLNSINPKDHHRNHSGNVCLLWIYFHQIIRQPYRHFQSLNDSVKIVINICLFTISILMMNLYIGNLGSRLAVSRHYHVDSIEKFAREFEINDKLVTLAIDHTHMYDILKTSEIRTFYQVTKRLKYVDSVQTGFNRIIDSNVDHPNQNHPKSSQQFALIAPRTRLHYNHLIMENHKYIYIPPVNGRSHFFTMFVALPLTKAHDDYRHDFDILIHRLTSYGMFDRWKQRQYMQAHYYHNYYFHNPLNSMNHGQPTESNHDHHDHHDEDGNDEIYNVNNGFSNFDSNIGDKYDQFRYVQSFSIRDLRSIFYVYLLSISFTILALILEIFNYFFKFFKILKIFNFIIS